MYQYFPWATIHTYIAQNQKACQFLHTIILSHESVAQLDIKQVDNPCSVKKENSLLSQNDTIAKDLASNLASERENLQNELMDVKLKLEATGAYLHKSLQENIRLEVC